MCFTRFGLIILSVFIRKYLNLYSKRLFEIGCEPIPRIALESLCAQRFSTG